VIIGVHPQPNVYLPLLIVGEFIQTVVIVTYKSLPTSKMTTPKLLVVAGNSRFKRSSVQLSTMALSIIRFKRDRSQIIQLTTKNG